MDDDADGSVDVTETDGVRAAAFVCGFVVCSVERLMLQHSALCPIYKQVLAWKDTVAFGLLTRDIYLCKATLKKAMYCQKCFTNTWQCSTVKYNILVCSVQLYWSECVAELLQRRGTYITRCYRVFHLSTVSFKWVICLLYCAVFILNYKCRD